MQDAVLDLITSSKRSMSTLYCFQLIYWYFPSIAQWTSRTSPKRHRQKKLSKLSAKIKRIEFRGLFCTLGNVSVFFQFCVARKKTMIIDAIISSSDNNLFRFFVLWLWGQILRLTIAIYGRTMSKKRASRTFQSDWKNSQTLCAWCDLFPVLDVIVVKPVCAQFATEKFKSWEQF